jgi:hypothetical protein
MTHEICPDCGRKALRYRKRTKDYSCAACPFEGDAALIERRVAEAPDERLVALANEHRHKIGVLADPPGSGTADVSGCTTGAVALVVAAGTSFVLFQSVFAGAGGGARILYSALAFVGTLIVAWAATFFGVFFIAQRKVDARHAEAVANERAEHERWRRENADLLVFRERPFVLADLADPRIRQLIESLVPYDDLDVPERRKR